MHATPHPRRLTNAQALLLNLFDRDLSEAELTDMRQVLTRHFANKAEEEAERVMKAKGQTARTIEQSSKAINENRTSYRQRLRSDKQ